MYETATDILLCKYLSSQLKKKRKEITLRIGEFQVFASGLFQNSSHCCIALKGCYIKGCVHQDTAEHAISSQRRQIIHEVQATVQQQWTNKIQKQQFSCICKSCLLGASLDITLISKKCEMRVRILHQKKWFPK